MEGRGPGYDQLAICCVDSNELSGSIKCGEFLDYLRIYWILKDSQSMWLDRMMTTFSPIGRY